jgi:hypothetical protein
MSEKLDGYRGYWDGKNFLSKNGTLVFVDAHTIMIRYNSQCTTKFEDDATASCA